MIRRSRWGIGSYSCGCWLIGSSPPLPPLPRVFSPTSILVYYRFVGSRAPSPPPCSSFSSPVPVAVSRYRFPPLVPGALFSPRYYIVGQASGLAPEAFGYLQTPPSVYGVDVAGEMTAPDVLLRLYLDAADFRALYPPPPPIHYRPRSHLLYFPRSRLRSCPVPVPVSVSCSFSSPPSFPFPPRPRSTPFGPDSSLGIMRLHGHRVLRTELLGARKRHSLSPEKMSRVERSVCCKTKENRRRRRSASVPSARCRNSLKCISDLCSTDLMASSLIRAFMSGPASPHVDMARGNRE